MAVGAARLGGLRRASVVGVHRARLFHARQLPSAALAQGVELQRHRVLDVARRSRRPSTAPPGCRARAQAVEDAPVALGQPVGGELQAAEAVAFVRVGAGQVEQRGRAARAVAPPELRPARASSAARYGVVARSRRAARRRGRSRSLRNGKFFAPCSDKREHGRVVAEDRRRAVALVHVEVDDRDAQQARGARRCHSACISRAATATSLKTQ